MKSGQNETKCVVCGEPAKHKLKDKPWCGNTPCYFEIATASEELGKSDDDKE